MYQRTLQKVIQEIDVSFPILLITGPRQVGKTTLLTMCADTKRNYVTLDDLEARQLAQTDPALFLQSYKPPLIIDEIQYAPQLFSSLKMVVDREKKNGLFWLTGSQKFHLMKGISESLAGRVAIVDLLGFSAAELKGNCDAPPFLPTETWLTQAQSKHYPAQQLMDVYHSIWLGSFPTVHRNKTISSRDIFYRSYTQTYIQRDIKDLLNISDPISFHRFLGAVAARTGQLLNYADLARDVAIDSKTAKTWLSALEASGLIYLLHPYHRNVTKRLLKTPKLYFLDTGLCSYLTKWPHSAALEAGAMSGAILETYLFTEILKSYLHHGMTPNFYYYRDFDQGEVDLIIDGGNILYPVEFKKTATPSQTAHKNFHLLTKLGMPIGHGAVICFVERAIPLSREVTAMPIGYL